MAEFLKVLWAKLYAWTFPSALALAAFVYVILPQFSCNTDTDKEAVSLNKYAFFAAAIVLGLILSSLKNPLYRFLEGNSWPMRFRESGVKRQLGKKHEIQSEIQSGQVGRGWLLNLKQEEYGRYPMNDQQVVPSRFGNAIRSFEQYGKSRFNLDSQTLWHELLSVSPKYFSTEIESSRSSVDFFVTVLYLSALFALICLGTTVYKGLIGIVVLSFFLSIIIAFASFVLALQSIDEWGAPIRALVNVGRIPLAKSLGLEIPEKLKDERRMWGMVTRYIYDANAEAGAGLDEFRKERLEGKRRKPDGGPSGGDNGNKNNNTDDGEDEDADDD